MKGPKDDNWDLWEEEDAKPADFSRITRKIIAYWPYSLLCALILAGLAFLYLYKTNPVYNVKASILIQDNDNKTSGNNGGMLSSLQDLGLLSGTSNVDNEQIVITSYPLMEGVVKDLQLYLQFSASENLRDVPLYRNDVPFKADVVDFDLSRLNKEQLSDLDYKIEKKGNTGFTISSQEKVWNGVWNTPILMPFGHLTLRNDSLTGTWEEGEIILMHVYSVSAMVDHLIAAISADIPNKQTSVINLSLQTTLPQQGKDVLNDLLSVYQGSTVEDNNKLNDSTLQFINQRLSIVGFELDSIEQQIQHFKQKNELADLPTQTEALVDNMSKAQQDLNSQLVQLSIVNSLIEYMKANKNNPRVIPASLILQNQTLADAVSNYNQLLIQRERLQLSATKENPILQNVEGQVQGLQKTIFSGLESIRLTLTTGIEKTKQQNSVFTGIIRKVPGMERTFGSISRQQSIKQELYVYLLQKREEALIAKSSTLSNSRIIAPARAENAPVKPKRRLILSGAFLLGLLLPFGYERVYRLFNTRISSKEDITNRTDAPIIGEIGHKSEDKLVVITNGTRNIVSEQFRALRTNIQFLFTRKEDKVILITSTITGEGKSFVSSNLATVFAMTGKKVVLLEMDLRKPKIVSGLGLTSAKGFTQYIMGNAEISDIIIPSGIHENLFVIPAGAIPPNPSELLQHERTDALFEYLRANFDVILVDTPPNVVSDAQLLNKNADVTLYIVRINYTHREQVDLIRNMDIAHKLPKLNVVVNDIKPKRYGGSYYGYGGYGGYGYGSGYGYYYGQETADKPWWSFGMKIKKKRL